jgi:hypothetical protein
VRQGSSRRPRALTPACAARTAKQDDRPGGRKQPEREDGQGGRDSEPEDRHNDAYLREDEVLEILDRRREDVGAGPSAQPRRGERDERLVCRDPSPREQVQGGVV